MKKFVILIPPSEGKTPDGNKPPLSEISKETQHILGLWKNVPKNAWGKALGVKSKALDKAIEINKNILSAQTFPAIERYSGVVYDAIDYASLKPSAKIFFDKHVRIVSAVFGLLAPTDLIPNYKFKINNFGADKYWRAINKDRLKDTFVIDLLPQAHKKAVECIESHAIDFHFLKNGKKVPAGHHGKRVKGRFVRWLAEQGSVDEKTLKGFCEDGFKWTENGYSK